MRRLVRMTRVSSPVVAARWRSSSWWVARLLYGASASPLFGQWNVTSSGEETSLDSTTRVLYCKALIHASGGGRRARDWVAGCSAVVCPSESLLDIALKHNGTEQDVERYREHLIATLCRAAGESEGGGGSSGTAGGEDALVTSELGNLPEARCFVYDAMKAASFHRYQKVPTDDLQRLYDVAKRLGVDEEVARGIWRLVEEGAVEREKQRALDYPWSE